MADTKSPVSKVIEADKQARESSPTFMRNRSLTKGAEGGVETFKLRSKLLKTKLTKAEVENLMEELTKCKIVTIEDLVGLDQDAILALSVKPHVRAILFQVAKKHNETFRLKDLFVESNSFLLPGVASDSVNDACDRVAGILHTELGLRRWKDFLYVAPDDLTQIPEISLEEANQVSDLVRFARDVNWSHLKNQYDQVQQSMEVALKNYMDLLRNLSLFQNFVTVGAPLDASLNELSNMRTKLSDQRDAFIRELSGTQAAGDSIEEDAATHALRPHAATLTAGGPWRLESTSENTSFRQQLRSLQLDASSSRTFRKHFVDPSVSFVNFIGEKKVVSMNEDDDDSYESVVVTFEKKKTANQSDSSLLLVQSSTGDDLLRLPAVGRAKDMIEVLYKTPTLADFDLSRIKELNGDFTKALLALEKNLSVLNFKVGVLYVHSTQTKEEEIITNKSGSHAYNEFLKLLGDRVALKGWKQFAAGLDTRDNRSGTHAVYTTHEGYSIMFHVATMMPYENEDQKLERKRHIGNDVVVIVFCDEGATFNPTTIRTEFTHVYFIVTPMSFNNRPYYRVEVATKEGVTRFGPLMPNCLFPNTKAFRQFLLTKLINADIAASHAPVFKKRIMRTRIALLGDLVSQAKQSKWTKSGKRDTAPPLEREASTKSIRGTVTSGFKTLRAKSGFKIDDLPDETPSKTSASSSSRPTLTTSGSPIPAKDSDKEKSKSPRP